jgi:hydroxyacylglutathione hydrolase
VLHTPGHTPGGISLYADGAVFVGDTLFAGSIGRTDFPGGDFDTLKLSIQRKLYTLNDDVAVYPGHMGTTSIGREKRTNPFVRLDL